MCVKRLARPPTSLCCLKTSRSYIVVKVQGQQSAIGHCEKYFPALLKNAKMLGTLSKLQNSDFKNLS